MLYSSSKTTCIALTAVVVGRLETTQFWQSLVVVVLVSLAD